MDNLEQLYNEREILRKYNASTEEIDAKISAIITAQLQDCAEIVIGFLPYEIEAPENSNFVVAAQYINGRLVRTATSFNTDLRKTFESAKEVSDYEMEDEVETAEDDGEDRRRSKSIGFSVKFADGKIINHSTAQRTMIEALRYMGLERASHFCDETFKGFPLVSKERRTTDGRRWQRMVDGWWIYINMGNERKQTCLKGVAKMLNIDIEIIPKEVPSLPLIYETGNRRMLYSVNGSHPMAKNRIVWAIVKLYLETEAACFNEIVAAFPADLQGSYGVVRSIEDIKKRGLRNKTENGRWFLKKEEIFKSLDGIEFAVCKEWGHNFETFKKHVNNVLKYDLVEA